MTDEILQNAPMGVTLLDNNKAIFKVWAPNAAAVFLLGDFNNWDDSSLPLAAIGEGNWGIISDNIKNNAEYKFGIKTQSGDFLQKNDPYARKVTNSIGNSVIYKDEFDWEGFDQFELESFNKLVIYELHIGTFNKKENQNLGDFSSAIEKLDYLVDLGVNVIEVMPIAEFPGDFSWGYNPAHPFAVESTYGGPDGFKNLVKEAHKRNIGVVLDVVYNHFGPSDMDIWQFDGWHENDNGGIYFYNDWKAKTPWGETRPDYGRNEVRSYIYDNAMMWLNEFKCDGLRMDMIPYIRNVNADGNPENDLQEGKSLLQIINQDIKNNFHNKLIIAEDLHTKDEIVTNVSEDGFGYSSQWCAAFVHPVRALLTTMNDDDRDLFSLQNAMIKKYDEDAFSRIIYTESHDEVANGQARIAEEIAVDDVDNYYSKKRAQLGAALVLTSPGIPMIFQGQELLEDGFFNDTTPINWDNVAKYGKFVNFFKELIVLRRNGNGFSNGLQSQNVEITHLNNESKVIAYHRFENGGPSDSVFIVMNLSNREYTDYEIEFPFETNWELVLNSDSDEFDDENKNREVSIQFENSKSTLTIYEYGLLVFVAK